MTDGEIFLPTTRSLAERLDRLEAANTKKVAVRFDKIDAHTKRIRGYIGTIRRMYASLSYRFDDGFRLLEKRRRADLLEFREGIRDQNTRIDEIEYVVDQLRECVKDGGR